MRQQLLLADLCSLIVDCKNRTPPRAQEGEKAAGYAIGTPHVADGRINLTNAYQVNREVFETWTARATPQPEDIVLTREAPVGRVGAVEEGMKVCLGQRTMLLRPNTDRVFPRFLQYLLLGSDVQRTLHSRASGSTVAHLRVDQVRNLPIPMVPSLREQRSIAEVLGALDDKVAANERQLNTLNEYCSAWHERSIIHAIAGTPHTLAELVKRGYVTLGDGYRTKQAEHGEPGLPILRVSDVGRGAIIPSFTHFVSNSYRSAMGPKVSQRGDVILTTKGTVGRVAIIEAGQPEFVYSPQVCYFRLTNNSPVSPLYLLHWFQGKEFWRQAGRLKGQTDMADYLSLRDIRSLKITVPSPTDLAEFNRVCNPMQEQSEVLRRENRTLTTLRDTLLPELLTGKIRVKDAERIMEDAT
ncbi:restriction endonuclease subunit S [Streptomyces sp. NPDC101178]|uniref:restriction endonuclease subunit S n=1 Tax=Streptomyces sp. NPDC101178 TaxID=3366124 RepID=UPI0037F115E0